MSDKREELITQRVKRLKEVEYSSVYSDQELIALASRYVDEDLFFRGLLSDQQILDVQLFIFLATAMFVNGQRHLSSSLGLGENLLPLKGEALRQTIAYVEARHIEVKRPKITAHPNCPCPYVREIRLVWRANGSQFIYTT